METRKTRTSLELKVYPFHMTLDVWVRAHNSLGAAESEHLQEDASCFGERRLCVHPPTPHPHTLLRWRLPLQ